MDLVVPNQRILRGVTATLSWQNVDENGAASDPGVTTVGVTKADGTIVIPAGTATVGINQNPRQFTLTAPNNATLELLTATWTAADGSTHTTLIEVVGGFFFTIVEARASDPTLSDTTKYPDAAIIAARLEVEVECEEICDVAFVPRYARLTLDGDGTGDLTLGNNQLRTVRTIRVYSSSTAYTTFTQAQLDDLDVDQDRTIHRQRGDVFDDTRRRNVVAEYEHGYNAPPPDLKRASLIRLRSRLNTNKSGIPDRAASYVVNEVGTFRISMPDAYKTGIPDVDAVYNRYSRRFGASGGDGFGGTGSPSPRPASGTLDFDPQRFSVFHGPRR